MSRVFLRNLLYIASRKECLPRVTSQPIINHVICAKYSDSKQSSKEKHLAPFEGFLGIKTKSKKNYLEMIDIFMARDRLKTGHVEFIYSALKHMKEFGVEKDLEVYKKLIDVFPKGKMIPRNIFQAEFMHYPKHQQCAIDLLEQMEENGVLPDWEMQDQLMNVFGSRGYPLRRYWRMMYWMPKFKNASPWPLPPSLPNDTLELAKLTIARITSVDPTTEITVYQTKEIADSLEDTWIVSGQSETQRHLISLLRDGNTLYVEGGLRVWIRNKAVTYFTLSTEHFRKFPEFDPDDVSGLLEKKKPMEKKTVHENDETVILGVASSGTSSPDSMLSWVRALTLATPKLARLQILFRVSQSVKDETPSLAEPLDKIDST